MDNNDINEEIKLTKYIVKCRVKLGDEELPIIKVVNATDFPNAVELVVNDLVRTLGVDERCIDDFEMGDI